MRKVLLNVPGPIPSMSRVVLRDNARLARIVAAVRHLEDAVKQSHYALAVDPLVAGQLQLLVRAVAGEETVAPVLAAPLMQALLTMTFRQLVSTSEGVSTPSPAARQRALFEQARTYIDANLEHEIYRDELARFLGIGGRQLNRIFRAEGGRSVTAYLLERRLERARMLLAKGLPVKEVAFNCGFSTPSYFSRFFKQYTGRAPSHNP
jgi:AraC-like DNA-binding protein